MNGHPDQTQPTHMEPVMKKFAFAAIAALIASASISTAADAGGRFHGHDGWHGAGFGPAFSFVIGAEPRIVVVNDEECWIEKVRHFDRHGNMYIKRVRVCE